MFVNLIGISNNLSCVCVREGGCAEEDCTQQRQRKEKEGGD